MAMLHEISGERLRTDTYQTLGTGEMTSIHPLDNQEGVFLDNPTSLVQGQVVVNSERLNWTLEIPQNYLAYDGLVHFLGGLGAIKQTSRPPRQALARQGVATLTSEPARGGILPTVDDICDPQKLHTKAQLAIAADLRLKRDEIRRKMPNGNRIDIDKKLLVPHSMGGAPAVGYAEEETSAVDMIVNLATIGRGAPTFGDIFHISPGDVARSMYHELLPAFLQGKIELSPRNFRDIMHYYSRIRLLFEATSCVNLNLRSRHEALRDKGVDIRSIDFKHDILVPIRSLQADITMGNAGHLAPQCKPGQVAAEIIYLEQHRKVAA